MGTDVLKLQSGVMRKKWTFFFFIWMIQLPGPLPTEEPAVHVQACDHGNRGRQKTKMAYSK